MQLKKRLYQLNITALFFALVLSNCTQSHSTPIRNYEKRNFQMNRYLFKKSILYKKRGQYFVRSNRTVRRGYYKASKRFTHANRHNFLYIRSLNGWIKEVLTSAAPQQIFINQKSMRIGKERVDKWYALPYNYVPHDMVNLPRKICKFRRVKMRKEAAQAFIRLVATARRYGLRIYAFSGYRSFATQRYLFLRRITIGRGIKQKAVAKPGHSEHQLGTTVDVVGRDSSLAAGMAFKYSAEAKWLRKHCYNFGFVLSYSRDNKIPTGYIYESWHIRYIGKKHIAAWMKKHLRR